MGSQNSISLNSTELSDWFVAQVRKGDYKEGKLLNLYYRPNQEIFTVSPKESTKLSEVAEPICKFNSF